MWLIVYFVVIAAANDILVLESQLNATQCQEIVAQAHGPINISRDPTWKGWDQQLFRVFDNAVRLYQAFIGHPLGVNKSKDYLLGVRNATHDSVAPFCDYLPIGVVLFVNDEVAGGQWYFPRQDKSFEPACGRLVMFPNTFTHPHGIKDVRVGTTWFVLTSFY